MKAAGVVLAVAIALVLQTTVSHYAARVGTVVDFTLVVVVYVALSSGPVTGMLTGAVAGLVQDALATGVIGIGGLAKTIVGFVTGIIGTQFIVAQPLPRFVVFFSATAVHAMIFIGLYTLLGFRQFGAPYGAVAAQALGNAIVGVLAFEAGEFLPGAVERRNAGRHRVRR